MRAIRGGPATAEQSAFGTRQTRPSDLACKAARSNRAWSSIATIPCLNPHSGQDRISLSFVNSSHFECGRGLRNAIQAITSSGAIHPFCDVRNFAKSYLRALRDAGHAILQSIATVGRPKVGAAAPRRCLRHRQNSERPEPFFVKRMVPAGMPSQSRDRSRISFIAMYRRLTSEMEGLEVRWRTAKQCPASRVPSLPSRFGSGGNPTCPGLVLN